MEERSKTRSDPRADSSAGYEFRERNSSERHKEEYDASAHGKFDTEKFIENLKIREEKEQFRRTVGKVLVVLGIVTILDSCAVFPIPLIGPPSIFIGGLISVIGLGVLASKTKMKLTNEALKVAINNNNRLTVARLALELDISLDKAEKIIKQFVKKGIAEIDIDSQDPTEGLVYKIRGI